jgi:hypothetical protein
MAQLDSKTQLSIAELAIYIILVPVVVYILIRHGKAGYLGWGFLIVFCGLRLASDGIQIGNNNNASNGQPVGSSGAIINAIGLSGLLYSLCSIIHVRSVPFPFPPIALLSLTVSRQLPPHPQLQPQDLSHYPDRPPPFNQHWHCPLRHWWSQSCQSRIIHK